MELRLGSGALGCRASVEECGAVPVSRQDLIRVWGALGFRKYEDFGGFSGGGGRWELWVEREPRLGLVCTTQLPLWASPLTPRSYLKLK